VQALQAVARDVDRLRTELATLAASASVVPAPGEEGI